MQTYFFREFLFLFDHQLSRTWLILEISVKRKHPNGHDALALTLTLPLLLPTKYQVLSVMRTLLRVGGSCAQANSGNRVTALHEVVALNLLYTPRLIDVTSVDIVGVILELDGTFLMPNMSQVGILTLMCVCWACRSGNYELACWREQ